MSDRSAIAAVRERRRAEREQPTPDRRDLIFAATERLLEEVPLHDLSVARIMAEAKVARGTFYAYFESKYEVVAALMDEVMEQMYGLLLPYVERKPGVSPDEAIREVVSASAELWLEHRTVFRAARENRHAVPELMAQWLRVTERFRDAVAGELRREVAAGNAPGRRDERQIASVLVWSTEHLLYVAGWGEDDALPDERAIVDTVVGMWVGTLYRR